MKDSANQSNTPPLVSFIVPLYNKQNYIIETLESLHHCTYPNKEIIIVNDHSTDKSLAFVKKTIEGKNNFCLVQHEKNRGLSAARNTGLTLAKGEYIQFWDADDVYHPDNLLKIVAAMEQQHSDIATGIATRDGDILRWHKCLQVSRDKTTLLTSPVLFSSTSACFKIYRHAFLKQHALTFIEGLYCQDFEFNFRALTLAKHITMTPYVIGDYRQVDGSSCQLVSKQKIDDALKIAHLTKQHLQEQHLLEYEAFRQERIMITLFRFFIVRIVDAKATAGWHQYAAEYLPQFASILAEYRQGVNDLFERDCAYALMIAAITLGDYSLAERVLSKQPIDVPSFHPTLNKIAENHFNANQRKIKKVLRKYQKMTRQTSGIASASGVKAVVNKVKLAIKKGVVCSMSRLSPRWK